MHLNANVTIAGTTTTNALLKAEFPSLNFLILPSYTVRYSKRANLFAFKMLSRLPSILHAIRQEHRLLRGYIDQYKFHIVLSDNRYGLYSPHTFNILITHQISLKVPVFSSLVNRQVRSMIEKFHECWVPDEPEVGMSGELSQHDNIVIPVSYMGLLSRFSTISQITHIKPNYSIVAIISGPEPQRTLLEQILIAQLQHHPKPSLLIRGIPDDTNIRALNSNLHIVDHLDTSHMFSVIKNSSVVISRTGYTTLMDLYVLGKKAILIPTPGQSEQEYLGQYLKEKKLFHVVSQQEFDLKKDLPQCLLASNNNKQNYQNLLLPHLLNHIVSSSPHESNNIR